MTTKEEDLYTLMTQVRRCFNQMKGLAEQMHQDLGINPSMRAVMETLAASGRQTVPAIARAKGVSRQHIQTIMNGLLASKLAILIDNPAHKRSPLFDLTQQGKSHFTEIKRREQEPLQRLSDALPAKKIGQSIEGLMLLNQQLEDELKKGKTNA